MSRKNDRDQLLAIDIGATKVCAVAARRNDRRAIEVQGLGVHPCDGLSAQGIVNLETIVSSISNACAKALNQAPGMDVQRAVVGVSGAFIQSQNCSGSVVLSKHGRTVTADDIENCIQSAIQKSTSKDYEVLHAIPRWYRLDETQHIRDPLGMEGSVLQADVHLITGRHSILKNLRRCVQRAGFQVERFVFQPIASSYSTLSDEEKMTGVALVDIGGETTSVVVYYEGGIEHSETLQVGGEDITRDINHYFQTPYENAENLKKYSGSATAESIDPEERLEVVRFKNRRTIIVKKRRLCEIIEARVEYLIEEVIRTLRARDLLGVLFGGIVLTGGSSMLEGLREKAQSLIKKETHIGYPNGVVGYEEIITSPSYSTAIGLLHLGFEKRDEDEAYYGAGMRRVVKRVMKWMHEAF
ncbi:MAG: cell division protein FtsA [bacterium]|nr:cell division protein FtsA [bacterium]